MDKAIFEERPSTIHVMEEQCNKKVKKIILPQILAATSASLLGVACGTVFTWPATALIELQNPNSTLVLTEEEGSWVVSLAAIGGLPGTFIAGYLVDRLGRRVTTLLQGVPLLLSWIMIICAQNVWPFYIARLLAGITLGGCCVVLPMYLFEISGRENQALLGAFFPLSIIFGTLLCLVLSIFLYYPGLSAALAGVCILFLVTFYFAPETPVYYVIKEDFENARKSIRILHGESLLKEVLEETKETVALTSNTEKASLMLLMKDNTFIRGLIIFLGIVAAEQLCGMVVIMAYAEKVFMDTGSSIDPKIAANINFGIQFLAALLQLFIIERIPRKVLLLQSSVLECLTLGILGLQSLLHWEAGWLPIICIVVHSISYVWGFSAICTTIGGEVIAANAKEYAYIAGSLVVFILNFVVSKTYPSLVSSIGIGWTLMLFSGFMVLSTIHIIFMVPETRGKTLVEIQDELRGKSR